MKMLDIPVGSLPHRVWEGIEEGVQIEGHDLNRVQVVRVRARVVDQVVDRLLVPGSGFLDLLILDPAPVPTL